MEEVLIRRSSIVGMLFIGLPWLIFHYVTKWKQAPKITSEDEKLLDELHSLARRLEERVITVERIIAADNPDFRAEHAARRADPTDYDHHGGTEMSASRTKFYLDKQNGKMLGRVRRDRRLYRDRRHLGPRRHGRPGPDRPRSLDR